MRSRPPSPPYVQVTFDLHELEFYKKNTIAKFFPTDLPPLCASGYPLASALTPPLPPLMQVNLHESNEKHVGGRSPPVLQGVRRAQPPGMAGGLGAQPPRNSRGVWGAPGLPILSVFVFCF